MSSALEQLHQTLGGRRTTVRAAVSGPSWIADYGVVGERAFDREAEIGLVDRSWAGRLELVGEDRFRFLNGLVTCDVSAERLPAGSVRYGFLTEGKGRILSDLQLVALEDRLWLELPAGRAAAVREHLEKYIVADRVDVRPLADFALLALVGPSVWDRLAERYGIDASAAQRAQRVGLAGTDVLMHSHPRLGIEAAQLWVSSGIAAPLAEDLLEGLAARPLGNDVLEELRVAAGIPAWGVDFDERHLPGEVAVAGAVDWDKGCYLGQEIVARMHYRGAPARQLRIVSGEGSAPENGAALLHGGASAEAEKTVGALASVLAAAPPDTEEPRWSGLAMLRRAVLEEEEFRLADGRAVRLVGEPLPAS